MLTRLVTRTRDNKAHHKTPPAAEAAHRKHQHEQTRNQGMDRLFTIIASFPVPIEVLEPDATRRMSNLFSEAQARYQQSGVLKMPDASLLLPLLNAGADPNCMHTLDSIPVRRYLVHLLAFCPTAPDGGKSVIEALIVLAQAGATFTTSDIKQMVGPLRLTYPFDCGLEEARAAHRAKVLGQVWNEMPVTQIEEGKTRL